MKGSWVRVGLYSFIALALAGAIRFTPQLPDPSAKAADVLAVTQAGEPTWRLRFDTLGRGESLRSVLKRGGLSDDDASGALHAATTLDPKHIPAGMPITIKSEATDSAPSEVTLQLSMDRLLKLHRDSSGWVGTEEKQPWTTDTIVVGGTIASNLYDAINTSAKTDLPASARQQLAWALADVYDYRVDAEAETFSRATSSRSSPSGRWRRRVR